MQNKDYGAFFFDKMYILSHFPDAPRTYGHSQEPSFLKVISVMFFWHSFLFSNAQL